MAFSNLGRGIEPGLDTSLGLIYRLNNLWREIDRVAVSGDYDHWNFLLDRVFCNLLYRDEAQTIINLEGKITSIKITNKEYAIWKFLSENVFKAKTNLMKAQSADRKNLQIPRLKSIWYNDLMKKDLWIRKFMHNTLKLYLKEEKKAPGSALFGAFGARKR